MVPKLVQSLSLLLLILIGYGPTHVSCKCRVLVAKLFGGGHWSFGGAQGLNWSFGGAQGLIWSFGGAQELKWSIGGDLRRHKDFGRVEVEHIKAFGPCKCPFQVHVLICSP